MTLSLGDLDSLHQLIIEPDLDHQRKRGLIMISTGGSPWSRSGGLDHQRKRGLIMISTGGSLWSRSGGVDHQREMVVKVGEGGVARGSKGEGFYGIGCSIYPKERAFRGFGIQRVQE
jgi:hypothetical protein